MLTAYVVGYDDPMALLEDEERKRQARADLMAKAQSRDQQFSKEVKEGLHPTYKPFTYTKDGQRPAQENRLTIEAEQAPDADVGSRRFVDFGADNKQNRDKFFTGDPNVGITRGQAMSRFGRGLDKDAPFTAHTEVGKYNYSMPGRDPQSRRYMAQPDRFRGDADDWMGKPKTMPQKDTSQTNKSTSPSTPTSSKRVIDTPVEKQSLSLLDEFTSQIAPDFTENDAYTVGDAGLNTYLTRQAFKSPLAKPTTSSKVSPTGLTTTTTKGLSKFQKLGNLSKMGGRLALPFSIGAELADRFSVGETNVGGIKVDEKRLKSYDTMVKDLGLSSMKGAESDLIPTGGGRRKKGVNARNAFIDYATSGMIGRKFDPQDAPQVSAFVAVSTELYNNFKATKFTDASAKKKARKTLSQEIQALADSFVKQRTKSLGKQTADWAKARSKKSFMGKVGEDIFSQIGIPFMQSGRGIPEDDILDMPYRQ